MDDEFLKNVYRVAKYYYDDIFFEKYSRIYKLTTENICGYLNQINMKDKSILVPAASGDHLLNCILKGANNVDLFDINYYALFMAELKIAAVKSLSKEEFIRYFTNGRNALSNDIYAKIRPYLNGDALLFWDKVYTLFPNNNDLKKTNLFMKDNYYEDSLISVNDYLKENNYNYLKEKINIADNKKFINTNVIDLPNKLDKIYDIILLSNIQDYMKFTYHLDYLRSLEKYREFIKNDLMKYCNECIVGEYFYNNAAAPSLLSDASDETLYFDSINKLLSLTYDSTDDQVKIYKK